MISLTYNIADTIKGFKDPNGPSTAFERLKGIFQPFELGGVTRLIRSAVKFWEAGN
jgi:hypothetical protein